VNDIMSAGQSKLGTHERSRKDGVGDDISLLQQMPLPPIQQAPTQTIETIRRGELVIHEMYQRWELNKINDFLVWLSQHDVSVLPYRERIKNGADGTRIYRVIVDDKDQVTKNGFHMCEHYFIVDWTGITFVLAEHREE